MTIFNFDHPVDRTNTDSEKWHKYAGSNIIPLWIADTDFTSPPAVIDALQERVAHGVFGYGYPPENLIDSFILRMNKLYQWDVKAEWLVFLPGLVSGLNIAVRALTQSNQSTLCPCPIYPPFMKASLMAQRKQVKIPVKLINNRWILDIKTAEANLDGSEKLLMLCNPLNPGGTIFTREELIEQLNFARRHNLSICSDEIHCELLLDTNAKHIPIASLDDDAAKRTVTLMAPSKTFNIAGLGASIAVIPDATLREQFIRCRMGIVPSVDILAYVAAEAAYQHGDAWLQQLLCYLRDNHQLVLQRINAIPGLKMAPLAATYLAWIDASELSVDNPHTFFEQAGVGLSPGADFGNNKFVRLNFACRRALLNEALNRMEKAVLTR